MDSVGKGLVKTFVAARSIAERMSSVPVNKNPLSPTSSGFPPLLIAIGVRPQAIASKSEFEQDSCLLAVR